jgi:hypothetical protein
LVFLRDLSKGTAAQVERYIGVHSDNKKGDSKEDGFSIKVTRGIKSWLPDFYIKSNPSVTHSL